MEELLLGLLWSILEPILEAVFEYLVAELASLLLRALGAVFEISAIQDPVLATCGYALFGILMGSLAFFSFLGTWCIPQESMGSVFWSAP